MKKLFSMVALPIALVVSSCYKDTECESLKKLASEEAFQNALEDWVSKNVTNQALDDFAEYSPTEGPGFYLINKEFTWPAGLNGNVRGRAKLLGDPKSINGVIFLAENRCGIIYALNASQIVGNNGISSKNIHWLTDRFAFYHHIE